MTNVTLRQLTHKCFSGDSITISVQLILLTNMRLLSRMDHWSLPCVKGARTEMFLNACVGSEHLEFNSMNSHLIVQWELWVKEGSERSVWASSMVWVTQPTGFSCWTGPGPIAPETGRNRTALTCVCMWSPVPATGRRENAVVVHRLTQKNTCLNTLLKSATAHFVKQ